MGLDDSGRPDFNLLQSSRSHASRIHYFVFDLFIYKNRVSRLALGFGFFIGLYGSRSKDSCSHFLLPFVTRDVPQISEFLEMATQVGVFTSMCNREFPYRKASKTPIVDN